MLYREIAKIVSKYLYGIGLVMLLPTLIAAYFQYMAAPQEHPQPHSTLAFAASVAITWLLAYLLSLFGGKSKGVFYPQEGFVAVMVIWFITPAIAGMPFIFSNTLKNPIDAYFEAASGITTTGATVMEAKKFNPETGQEIPIKAKIPGAITTHYSFYGTIEPVRDLKTNTIILEGIEAVSQALLFWRSLLQWLGGLGIVLLFIAILPAIGVGGKFLFQSEVSGPMQESVKPRIKETASELWKVYLGLTLLQIILLKITNWQLPWLDTLALTFGTLSTGGLCIHTAGIAYYDNVWTEWIIILFMMLGGINFSLYYYALRGKLYRFNQPEFWLYLSIAVVASLMVMWQIIGTPETPLVGVSNDIFNLHDSVRHGFFQVVSAMTTTGFYTMDYDKWPYAAQILIFILMFIGGMSGSTAGGMKVIRSYILFKMCQNKVETLFRPKKITKIRIGARELDPQSGSLVLCFFVIIIAFLVLGTFWLVLEGVDPETSLSVMGSSLTNTGMGFRMIAPERSFAFLSNMGMIITSLAMMFGRLEFFAVLVLLLPSFWKQMRS